MEAVMAENVSDRLHANAAPEEPHRERMPQAIHMLTAVRQAGLTHALAKEIPDGTVFEWDVWAARPQEEHRRSTRLSLATVLQVLTQQPQRAAIERERQRRARLGLIDMQKLSLPLDRVE